MIIYNSPGFPAGLRGTPVSDPYSLTASGILAGSAQVSIRAGEEGKLVIMGYDGQQWRELPTTVEGKTASGHGQLMELYLVVNQN